MAKIAHKEQIQVVSFKSKKKPQFMAALAASVGFFALGTVVAWSSPALPDIAANSEFHLTSDQKSWLAAFVPLGGVFGGPIGGYGIGKYGRQKTLLICSFPFTIGWTLIALAHSMTMMNFGRFLTGICCGVISLAMPIYVSEFTEESIRGVASSAFAVLCGLGVLVTYVLGSIMSWQALTITSATVPAAYSLLMYLVPETPQFLLAKGEKKQAGKALMWFRGATSYEQIEPELQEMRLAMESNVPRRLKPMEYFAPEIIKSTTICMVLMLLQQFSGINSVVFYSVDIFQSAGTNIDPNMATIVVGFVFLCGVFLFAFLIDRVGRRVLLLVSGILLTTCLTALGYFFFAKSRNDPIIGFISWLPLVSLVVFAIAFNIGFGPLPWLMMAELIPPHVKGLTSGIATVFNWMLAFLVTKSFEELNSQLGGYGTYWMFAGVCAFGIVFIHMFVPETKGKKLEEIQLHFRGRSTSVVAAAGVASV